MNMDCCTVCYHCSPNTIRDTEKHNKRKKQYPWQSRQHQRILHQQKLTMQKNKQQHTHGQSLPETRKDGNGITAAQTTAAQTKVRRCNLSKPYRGLMNMSPSKWNSKNQRITTNALGRQAWNTTQEEPPPLKDSTWHS